jgi:hypothetical protein
MAESVTRFLGEDASLGKTIQNLEGRLDGFGTAAASVGTATGALPAKFAAVAAGVVAFAASVASAVIGIKTFSTALDFVEKINNLKAATGASAEELIKLQRAFDLTGSSADKVGPAINKVQDVITKAGENSPKAVEKLNLLKLTFDQLKNLSPAEQLERVMKAIDALPTPAEKARAAMAIFGDQLGRELLPLIKDFDGEMAKAVATLGSLPRIIDQYGPAIGRFGNAIDALKQKPTEFSSGVVGPMSVLLGELAQRFATFDAAALGERIGIALNSALVQMVIWAENVSFVLRGIWNGLSEANVGPVLQDVLGAFDRFVEAAKLRVSEIYLSIRDANWSAVGENIGKAIAGAFRDPGAFVDFLFDYMDLKAREFANLLPSLIATGIKNNQLTLDALFQSGSIKNISDLLYDGLLFAITKAGEKGFESYQTFMRAPITIFEELWTAAASGSGEKLKEAILNNLRTIDWLEALNPFQGFTNKLARQFGNDLSDNVKGSANTFYSAYSEQSGNFFDKFSAGWSAVSDRASKEFGAGLAPTAESIINAGTIFAEKATFTKIEMLDTTASAEQAAASWADLTANAEKLPGISGQVAQDFNTAKLDVTGSGGIAPALDANASALNQTADKTQSASGTIVTAFEGVATSGNTFKTATDGAGQSFAKQADAAGRALESGVRNAMKALTDSVRGFATEATLQRAAASLERLERKLPQPVLV